MCKCFVHYDYISSIHIEAYSGTWHFICPPHDHMERSKSRDFYDDSGPVFGCMYHWMVICQQFWCQMKSTDQAFQLVRLYSLYLIDPFFEMTDQRPYISAKTHSFYLS